MQQKSLPVFKALWSRPGTAFWSDLPKGQMPLVWTNQTPPWLRGESAKTFPTIMSPKPLSSHPYLTDEETKDSERSSHLPGHIARAGTKQGCVQKLTYASVRKMGSGPIKKGTPAPGPLKIHEVGEAARSLFSSKGKNRCSCNNWDINRRQPHYLPSTVKSKEHVYLWPCDFLSHFKDLPIPIS